MNRRRFLASGSFGLAGVALSQSISSVAMQLPSTPTHVPRPPLPPDFLMPKFELVQPELFSQAGGQTNCWADFDGDNDLDLFVGFKEDIPNRLYRNDGGGNFTDVSYQAGIAEVTIPFLGWGAGFLDYDNDGWLDLFAANGHVYPGVDQSDWGTTFAERPLLFRNLRNGKFEVVPPVKGTGLASLLTARGAAFGDLFNDGKIDVVINQLDNPPALLRNVNADKNHWVGIKLIGGPKSPRDAVGASVYVTTGGTHQRADVISGGSYASSNDQRLHFGLGSNTKVDSVEIRWPSGAVEHVSLPAVDCFFTIVEGKGVAPTGQLTVK